MLLVVYFFSLIIYCFTNRLFAPAFVLCSLILLCMIRVGILAAHQLPYHALHQYLTPEEAREIILDLLAQPESPHP
jgi:hypothetical protein